jgi:hypothetical protein
MIGKNKIVQKGKNHNSAKRHCVIPERLSGI